MGWKNGSRVRTHLPYHDLGEGLYLKVLRFFSLTFECFALFCCFFFQEIDTCFIFLFFFSGPHPWHMEVPRRGVESDLSLPAYTRATATRDPSRVCDRHHSSRQRPVLNPLSEARDQTPNLMVPSRK